VTSATVKGSTPTAVETSSAAEARLPARGKSPRNSSAIEAAERAGMTTRLDMRSSESVARVYESMLRGRSMEPRISARAAALKSASTSESVATIEVGTRVIEVVAIGEDSAAGDIAVVMEDDSVAMPVISPVVPSPAKAAKQADAKAEAPRNSRPGKVQSRIPIPARPNSEGLAIDQPGIVCRHKNNLGINWLDHDRLPLPGHSLL
jgi:hypothetical protein